MAKAQGKAKGGKPAASTTTTRKAASKATASRKSASRRQKPAARKPAARARGEPAPKRGHWSEKTAYARMRDAGEGVGVAA